MDWKCDKCGSKEVQQEYSVMLPMNSEDGWEKAIENCYGNDFYWCRIVTGKHNRVFLLHFF